MVLDPALSPALDKTSRLQGTDISPSTAASPTAIPQEPLIMTPRFSAGPDTSPASKARKLPPNLIPRFLPTFLIFLFHFFSLSFMTSSSLLISFLTEY